MGFGRVQQNSTAHPPPLLVQSSVAWKETETATLHESEGWREIGVVEERETDGQNEAGTSLERGKVVLGGGGGGGGGTILTAQSQGPF